MTKEEFANILSADLQEIIKIIYNKGLENHDSAAPNAYIPALLTNITTCCIKDLKECSNAKQFEMFKEFFILFLKDQGIL